MRELCMATGALALIALAGCGGSVTSTGTGTGAGGTTCGAAGGPDACVPVSLGTLMTQGGIVALQVDTTNVYLADDGGEVFALPVAGGSSTLLTTIAAAYDSGASLALDATNVYFSGGGTVGVVPKAGGAAKTLFAGSNAGLGLAITGGDLYWTESFTSATKPGDVLRMPASGGSPATVASGLELPLGLVTDGTDLYFIVGAAIDKVATGGGAVTMLVPESEAQVLAVDGGYVYYALDSSEGGTCGICPPPPAPKPTDSTVYRVPVAGGTPAAIATGYRIDSVAVDAVNAYWFDNYAKTLSTAPIAGGTPTVLATNVQSQLGPVVDESAIYWVAIGGAVMRMPKSPK